MRETKAQRGRKWRGLGAGASHRGLGQRGDVTCPLFLKQSLGHGGEQGLGVRGEDRRRELLSAYGRCWPGRIP